jgi:hypothetical protein
METSLPGAPLPPKLSAPLAPALPVLLFENAELPMSMFIVAVSRASVRIANWR